MKTARWWRPLENGAVRCELCPHQCRIPPGGHGRCHGRVNRDGTLVAATWGRPAAVQVDPIEKKPLNHFLPGADILSLGTLGCNLACRFCQNWSLSHPEGAAAETMGGPEVLPAEIARLAAERGIPAVAATYNEPAVWAEYALDLADAVHAKGLRMAAVTSGYFAPESRLEFFRKMDAANVDLKSFRDEFYAKWCGAHLAPVLETLETIRKETACWLEVTTLLIPGLNDSAAEIDELTAWMAEHLGADTPLHFSAFHPDGQMRDRPPTPPTTLRRAREQARENGLHHVYVGNVRGEEDATATFCPDCGARLIDREGFRSRLVRMDPDGRCQVCGRTCAGVWR